MVWGKGYVKLQSKSVIQAITANRFSRSKILLFLIIGHIVPFGSSCLISERISSSLEQEENRRGSHQ